MTDRDRLIEQINKTFAEQYEKRSLITAPHTAVALLANGVIAPPCKVGDILYMPWIWNDTKGVAVLTVTHIIIDSLHAYVETDFTTDDEEYYNAYNCGRFDFNEFGVIVFTDLKEAEAALKERENNE